MFIILWDVSSWNSSLHEFIEDIGEENCVMPKLIWFVVEPIFRGFGLHHVLWKN